MPKTINKKAVQRLQKALNDHDLSKQEYIRIQAVCMKKQGFTMEQVMRANGKPRVTIEGWITVFNKEGVDGLLTKTQTSHHVKLDTEQKQTLKAMVHGHKPEEYGYTQGFWSIPMLKDFIKKKFEVVYKSEKSYQDLFAFCGFSYQKVEHIDHRKDETDPRKFKVRLRKRLKKGVFLMSW